MGGYYDTPPMGALCFVPGQYVDLCYFVYRC